MDYENMYEDGGDVVLTGVKHFIPGQTLDCGQCFRWRAMLPAYAKATGLHASRLRISGKRVIAYGEKRYNGDRFTGIAHGRRLEILFNDGVLTFKNITPDEFETTWKEYFDFNRDYGAVRKRFSSDAALADAMDFSPGLRLMKQEPWEMLITFILSQNSNIPRIKLMVERLCESFGVEAYGGGRAFPSPERLAALDESDLAPVKCGYRAEYILDAARKAASGGIDLNALYILDAEDAHKELIKIKGVGPKVSDCVLLFGYGSLGRIPKDVWMKRVMAKFYANGFPEELKDIAGIAQQFLFHYARSKKII